MNQTNPLLWKTKTVTKRLCVVLGICVLSQNVVAQTPQQVKKIRAVSKLETMAKLKKAWTMSDKDIKRLEEQAKKKNIPVRFESEGRRFQLKGFEKDGRPIYYTTWATDAARITGVDELWPSAGMYDLDGDGMIVYQWDEGGVLLRHVEFGGRAENMDSPREISNHSTHVAGTMAASGVNPRSMGMAPKAKIRAYDWENDMAEFLEAASQGALVANASYGLNAGWLRSGGAWWWYGEDIAGEDHKFGAYTNVSAAADAVHRLSPYFLLVKAVGNANGYGPAPGTQHKVWNGSTWVLSSTQHPRNGGDGGYDTAEGDAIAKNVLSVGAINKFTGVYTNPTDAVIGDFSSTGPTNDGRLKPDLVGVGVDVYTPESSSDRAYDKITGTSFSAPNVSGGLILLQQLYSRENHGNLMQNTLLKAVAINGCDEVGPAPGPDYKFGYGLFNASKSAKIIVDNHLYSMLMTDTLGNGSTRSYKVVAKGGEPIKVTLVWNDAIPSKITDQSKENDRTRMLVNDLDVRITKDGVTYSPWVLDGLNPSKAATKGDNVVDNVEQIVIDNPMPGETYTITVSHKGSLKGNSVDWIGSAVTWNVVDAQSQPFSIVATGLKQVNDVDLTVNDISSVSPENFTSHTNTMVKVSNNGVKDAQNIVVVAHLYNMSDNKKEIDRQEIFVNEIKAGATVNINDFNFNLVGEKVDYLLTVEVLTDGENYTYNNTRSYRLTNVGYDLTLAKNVFETGFETDLSLKEWTLEDTDNNGTNWMRTTDNRLTNNTKGALMNVPGNDLKTNDWIFSPALKVKGGRQYRLSLKGTSLYGGRAKISISWGNLPQSGKMENVITTNTDMLAYDIVKEFVFTVPQDQIIYLGFNQKAVDSKVSAMAIDDVKVETVSAKPDVDFTVSNDLVGTTDRVEMVNLSGTVEQEPITSYEWSFNPTTVRVLQGSLNSTKPIVRFEQEGDYTITLKATNSVGTSELTKENIVHVKNESAKADFSVAKPYLLKGDTVTLINLSAGRPAPTSFVWTVEPMDGVTILNGSDRAKELSAVFTKSGKYTVSLAISGRSGSNTVTKENFVEIVDGYAPVKNLDFWVDKNNQTLGLMWNKPTLLPTYFEGFEAEGIWPIMSKVKGSVIYDANRDDKGWSIMSGDVYQGASKLVGNSAEVVADGKDVDDWYVFPMQEAGVDYVSMAIRNESKERFDIWLVNADNAFKTPSIEEFKAGHSLYSVDGNVMDKEWTMHQFDVKPYSDRPFYVAVHHRTRKEDGGGKLEIDQVEVGYNTSDASSVVANGSTLYYAPYSSLAEYAVKRSESAYPALVGYEVYRGDALLDYLSNKNITTYALDGNDADKAVYKVYALYADGMKSEAQTIDLATDVTVDRIATALNLYATDGARNFKVVAGNGAKVAQLVVRTLSGDVVYQARPQFDVASLRLDGLAQGVYLVHALDNQGNKAVWKLILR